MKDVRVGEVLDDFMESFSQVKDHQNTKLIQAAEFQNDISDPTKRVLQIDFAPANQCELQNEITGALWTRGNVNLFTCAVYHKIETKTLIFGTDYKGKDKFSTRLFVETLYKEHILPNDDIKEEIIWSDGPRSELKNQYMRYVIEILSNQYKKVFSWKCSATAHRKGVVDGVGGKVRSSVHKKVMSFGKEKIIVQDAESFCIFAKELSKSTTVICISNDDVEAYKRTDPFADSVPVPGISKMHVMISNCENTQLWLNSAYQNQIHQVQPSVTKASISFL